MAKQGRGWAFRTHDFPDQGDPSAIGMDLTRLFRAGKLRRIARGLCNSPHPILGQPGATSESVIAAVAKGRHLRLQPSPQLAANQLGLSTQVPAQMICQTVGAPANVQSGRQEIAFLRNTGRSLGLVGHASGLVACARSDAGKNAVRPDMIQHLRQRLDASARPQFAEDLTLVLAWMRPIFQHITRHDS